MYDDKEILKLYIEYLYQYFDGLFLQYNSDQLLAF